MPNKEGYYNFPSLVRKQVKQEQNNACAFCGAVGCLEIHHIVPSIQKEPMGYSEKQITARENAVGLCGGEGKCHETFDILALHYNTYFDDVMENEGRPYQLPSLTTESAPPPTLQFPSNREFSNLYQVGDD